MASKPVKYLGINLITEVTYLYSENYKTLMKEIADDRNKWKSIPFSWISTPVFWPGELHGLNSPWGHKESDMTERISHFH